MLLDRREILMSVVSTYAAFSTSLRNRSRGAIKPEDFGAVGDGITDDYPAFKAALSELRLNGGGILEGSSGKLYRINSGLVIADTDNVILNGNGAGLFRHTIGTASNAFSLFNCKHIVIENWHFDSSYDGFKNGSTGSNPNVFLGVKQGSINRDIVIRNNLFTRGNVGGVLVGSTHIDAIIPDGNFANEDIWIENNSFSRAASAVFIYKASRRINVTNNRGNQLSAFGIACDTHAAATDPDLNHYNIEDVSIVSNHIEDIETYGAFQGRGITLKGGITNALVEKNILSTILSTQNKPTFGILVTEDQHSIPSFGKNITIRSNVINNVRAVAPGASGSWAMSVGPGTKGVSIAENTFDGAQRGVQLSNNSGWTFVDNHLVNLATEAEAPIFLTSTANASVPQKTIKPNFITRGRGMAEFAVVVPASTSKLTLYNQSIRGFKEQNFVGSGATLKYVKP